LSVAFAETVTVPLTVAPLAGAVSEIVGGVVSTAPEVTNVKSPLMDSTPLEFFECKRKWYVVDAVSPVRTTAWLVTRVESRAVVVPYAVVVP
jgi:hypothetical protein